MSRQKHKSRRDPREESLAKGKTLLAGWGLHEFTLTAGTPAREALEKLSSFVGRDPASDLVLAAWMARHADAAVAAKLVSWEGETQDKELRREIRRSLFKLEQKGIRVERPQEPKPAFTLAEGTPEPRGYLGSIDGDGSRMAWLMRSDRGHMTALFTVISDRDGMTYVDAVTARRQALMATIREAISETGPMAEVPWTYSDALMSAAFRQGAPRPANTKADFLLNRAEVTKTEPLPVPPCPVVADIPESETQATPLLEKSAELFREREFASWVLPPDIAHRFLEKYVEASKSGLVLSKEAATERLVGIMDAALEEFASGLLRTLFVRRLEETAWLLSLRGRADAARQALAVARALNAPGTRPVKEISFLRIFVFRAFAPYLAPPPKSGEAGAEPSEPAEGGSRIIDPSSVRALDQGPAADRGSGGSGEEADSPLIIRP